MKNIIVNATASRTSGALTILNQFIDNISVDENFHYTIFVDKSFKVLSEKSNVDYIYQNKRSFVKRFLWDAFGVKKYLNKNEIEPFAGISFQNTGFRMNILCPNYIYYHQSIPFYPVKWSPFKPDERIFWFYKNIYPFFVSLFLNKRTNVFVQLEYIKEGFIKKYKIAPEKVHVIFPDIDAPASEVPENLVIDRTGINLFYPATPFKYKNHQLLFEALSILDTMRLKQKIVLYLTCKREDFVQFPEYKNIEVVFLGVVDYSNVLWFYENVDALVFPSYIETLGLPLIEAAGAGLPIFAADLPYAREVLHGYEGAQFINHEDAQGWAMKLYDFSKSSIQKYKNFKLKDINSWDYFFKIIKQNT